VGGAGIGLDGGQRGGFELGDQFSCSAGVVEPLALLELLLPDVAGEADRM
jgi:hypothetical protein